MAGFYLLPKGKAKCNPNGHSLVLRVLLNAGLDGEYLRGLLDCLEAADKLME